MNKLDIAYTNLLKDILENRVEKDTRNGKVLSVFGRTIRHKMSDGFPLLTTKKMYFKGVITELLWFLRGDTNIKWLVENDCNIWVGDCYKKFFKEASKIKEAYEEGDMMGMQPHIDQMFSNSDSLIILTKEEFTEKIKTDDEFAKKWGDIGKGYGYCWRNWKKNDCIYPKCICEGDEITYCQNKHQSIDQISNLIKDLKTNPDSRRMIVTAWDPGTVDECLLPPCHYGFQVYTRELDFEYRAMLSGEFNENTLRVDQFIDIHGLKLLEQKLDEKNVPKRAISLMWNQRSVDTPLGLPFNIASYGLLLEIIAKTVNMVPDELIGNLGDTHIYLNQVEGCKEQIGREYSYGERFQMLLEEYGSPLGLMHDRIEQQVELETPSHTRKPFNLPKLNNIPDYLCECKDICSCYKISDFTLSNYQSHPKIDFPLSN